MAEGFDTNRFQSTVDQSFICLICLGVLKEPMQCENNEHYFCLCCIKKHLDKTSHSCPVCQDKLTTETLRKAPRIIEDFVSRLKIKCDHVERGCGAVLELEALPRHVQECDYKPIPCSNQGCDVVVCSRDVKQHETELCRYKTTECVECGEKMPHNKYGGHGCVLRRNVYEMKKDLTEMKATQQEMMNEMRESRQQMTRMTVAMENLERSCRNVSNVVSSRTSDIVVIGGLDLEAKQAILSVEKFNLFNQTWTPLTDLKTGRIASAAVVFQNQILVCGGTSTNSLNGCTNSIEVLDLNDNPPEWKKFSVNLPNKVSAHKCVVYGDRLLIIGGISEKSENLDTIYELLLVPPYSSKLLCHMKKKRYYHGVELFDDKVLIAGGRGAETDVEIYNITKNECVEMPRLPSPVWCMATVRRDDTMLLIGGMNDQKNVTNEIIEYDFITGKSEVLLVMKTERTSCSALYHGNTLVILGGAEKVPDENAPDRVDCYSFSSRSWKKLPSMSRARGAASAVIVKKDNFEF